MRLHRHSVTKIKITESEFIEALGLGDEGFISAIKHEYVNDYHRVGVGANLVEIEMVKNKWAARKPRPRRKR